MAQVLAVSESHEIDVIAVHGMGTTHHQWVGQLDNEIRTAFGVPEVSYDPDNTPFPKHPLPEPSASLSANTKALVYKEVIGVPGGSVNVYAIVWSPLTVPFKRDLCYDQHHPMDYCTGVKSNALPRAVANRYFKDDLLDDKLSDVVVYQSPAKSAIDLEMAHAIEAVLSDSTPNRARVPLFFITESLGSRVTWDAIALLDAPEMPESNKGLVARSYARTAVIFMAANQLPMLQLGIGVPISVQDRNASAKVGAVGTQMETWKGYSLKLMANAHNDARIANLRGTAVANVLDINHVQVVAFSDPNDLLSWRLRDSVFGKFEADQKRRGLPYSFELTDVSVLNSGSFLGFLIENPATAHTGYLENESEVVPLIVCGSAPGACR
jgi:hypothetical protein